MLYYNTQLATQLYAVQEMQLAIFGVVAIIEYSYIAIANTNNYLKLGKNSF